MTTDPDRPAAPFRVGDMVRGVPRGYQPLVLSATKQAKTVRPLLPGYGTTRFEPMPQQPDAGREEK